jgi:hypothetical protein
MFRFLTATSKWIFLGKRQARAAPSTTRVAARRRTRSAFQIPVRCAGMHTKRGSWTAAKWYLNSWYEHVARECWDLNLTFDGECMETQFTDPAVIQRVCTSTHRGCIQYSIDMYLAMRKWSHVVSLRTRRCGNRCFPSLDVTYWWTTVVTTQASRTLTWASPASMYGFYRVSGDNFVAAAHP